MALPEVREWTENPSRGPKMVGWPFRRCGSGRKALLELREWSEGPSGSPAVVG